MIITAAIYSKIKRMSMMQLDAYLKQVACNSFENGVRASEDVEEEARKNIAYIDDEELRSILLEVKGIGAHRADEVMKKLQERIGR